MPDKTKNKKSMKNQDFKNHSQQEEMKLSLLLRIREICEMLDINQKELATRMGVKPAYLSQLLNNKTDIQLSTFNRIVLALGARIEIII